MSKPKFDIRGAAQDAVATAKAPNLHLLDKEPEAAKAAKDKPAVDRRGVTLHLDFDDFIKLKAVCAKHKKHQNIWVEELIKRELKKHPG